MTELLSWVDLLLADDCCQHDRNLSLALGGEGEYIGLSDGQRFASLKDARSRDEVVSYRRSQQVDLKFHAENLRASRHQRVGRIAAGNIGQSCDHTSVNVSMLLRQVFTKW